MTYNFTVKMLTKNSKDIFVNTENSGNASVKSVEFILHKDELAPANFWNNMSALTLKLNPNNIRPIISKVEFIDTRTEQASSSIDIYTSKNEGSVSEEFLKADLHTKFMNNLNPELMDDILKMFNSEELQKTLEKVVIGQDLDIEFDY